MLLHPFLANFRSVADDTDTFKPEILFAKATEHHQYLRIEKRLASSESDFTHYDVFKLAVADVTIPYRFPETDKCS